MESQTVILMVSAKMIAMAMNLAREMVTRTAARTATRTVTDLPP